MGKSMKDLKTVGVLREISTRSIANTPIPVAKRSKARVYGRSLAGIAGSNPAGGIDGCPLCVVCVVR